MNKIFLITYIDDDTIEGFVEKIEEFALWLSKHNKRRREEGSLKEYKNEFEIKEVNKLE